MHYFNKAVGYIVLVIAVIVCAYALAMTSIMLVAFVDYQAIPLGIEMFSFMINEGDLSRLYSALIEYFDVLVERFECSVLTANMAITSLGGTMKVVKVENGSMSMGTIAVRLESGVLVTFKRMHFSTLKNGNRTASTTYGEMALMYRGEDVVFHGTSHELMRFRFTNLKAFGTMHRK